MPVPKLCLYNRTCPTAPASPPRPAPPTPRWSRRVPSYGTGDKTTEIGQPVVPPDSLVLYRRRGDKQCALPPRRTATDSAADPRHSFFNKVSLCLDRDKICLLLSRANSCPVSGCIRENVSQDRSASRWNDIDTHSRGCSSHDWDAYERVHRSYSLHHIHTTSHVMPCRHPIR